MHRLAACTSRISPSGRSLISVCVCAGCFDRVANNTRTCLLRCNSRLIFGGAPGWLREPANDQSEEEGAGAYSPSHLGICLRLTLRFYFVVRCPSNNDTLDEFGSSYCQLLISICTYLTHPSCLLRISFSLMLPWKTILVSYPLGS